MTRFMEPEEDQPDAFLTVDFEPTTTTPEELARRRIDTLERDVDLLTKRVRDLEFLLHVSTRTSMTAYAGPSTATMIQDAQRTALYNSALKYGLAAKKIPDPA